MQIGLLVSSKKVVSIFKNATDYGDTYLMMRVLKKCYDFWNLNSLILVPIRASAASDDKHSIYYTVIDNDNYWESNASDGNIEKL